MRRVGTLVGSVAIAIMGLGGGALGVAPPAAAAATITVNVDCSGPVTFYANVGDTVVLQFSDACTYALPNSQWNIWDINNTYLSETNSGFLGYVSTVGGQMFGARSMYASDWYLAMSSGGATTVTTTLLATDGGGAALTPGAVVAEVSNQWDVAPTPNRHYGLIYGGVPVAGGAVARNLTVWHQSVARPDHQASCGSGWTDSWEMWPHGGTGGPVCVRDVYAYYPNDPVH